MSNHSPSDTPFHDARRVCAVLVTYGQRWRFLGDALEELVEHQPRVAKVVVVDNGAQDPIATLVRERGWEARVEVVSLGSNTGSSGGFKAGIAAAHASGHEFIWLLDDDNRPQREALQRLFVGYDLLGGNPDNTMLSLRITTRHIYDATLTHGHLPDIYPADSCKEFHLFKRLAAWRVRKRHELVHEQESQAVNFPLFAIPYATYGGFLFHRDWVARVGYPREDFYLYVDDYEYTHRFVKAGGRIYLCQPSWVEDLDFSWSIETRRIPLIISRESSLIRSYYSLRNVVFFEQQFRRFAPVYWLNVCTYFTLILMAGLVFERDPRATWRRWRLLLRAFRNGLHGRLGRERDVEESV